LFTPPLKTSMETRYKTCENKYYACFQGRGLQPIYVLYTELSTYILNMSERKGEIIVETGPMFGGKTERICRKLKRVVLAKRSFIAIKPLLDKRSDRSLEEELERTVGRYCPDFLSRVFYVSDYDQDHFRYIVTDCNDISVLAIDEAQFFKYPWIVEEVKFAAWDLGKDVRISGLDLDYMRKEFGQMPALLAIADRVRKLRAVCFKCGGQARFTQRVSGGEEQIIIEGSGKNKAQYEARCGDCFYEYKAS